MCAWEYEHSTRNLTTMEGVMKAHRGPFRYNRCCHVVIPLSNISAPPAYIVGRICVFFFTGTLGILFLTSSLEKRFVSTMTI